MAASREAEYSRERSKSGHCHFSDLGQLLQDGGAETAGG